MKKWSNPQLLILGVENTQNDCDCDFGTGISALASSKHPCHKTGNGNHNDNGNHDSDGGGSSANPGQSGHIISTGCTEHDFCCCYTATPIS